MMGGSTLPKRKTSACLPEVRPQFTLDDGRQRAAPPGAPRGHPGPSRWIGVSSNGLVSQQQPPSSKTSTPFTPPTTKRHRRSWTLWLVLLPFG